MLEATCEIVLHRTSGQEEDFQPGGLPTMSGQEEDFQRNKQFDLDFYRGSDDDAYSSCAVRFNEHIEELQKIRQYFLAIQLQKLQRLRQLHRLRRNFLNYSDFGNYIDFGELQRLIQLCRATSTSKQHSELL